MAGARFDECFVQGDSMTGEMDLARLQLAEQRGAFLPAPTFEGSKPGYEFSTGALGTGYYSTDQDLLAQIESEDAEPVPASQGLVSALGQDCPSLSLPTTDPPDLPERYGMKGRDDPSG